MNDLVKHCPRCKDEEKTLAKNIIFLNEEKYYKEPLYIFCVVLLVHFKQMLQCEYLSEEVISVCS